MSYAFQGNAIQINVTTALLASQVVKTSEALLRSFSGRLDQTAPTGTYFLHFYNAVAVPVDGVIIAPVNLLLAAPTKINHVSGYDDAINIDLTANMIWASIGLCWAMSTTEFTKTVITSPYVSASTLFQ